MLFFRFNEVNIPLYAQCIVNKDNQLYRLYLNALQHSWPFKIKIHYKTILPRERKKAVQPNGCTALIHQLFSSEWQ